MCTIWAHNRYDTYSNSKIYVNLWKIETNWSRATDRLRKVRENLSFAWVRHSQTTHTSSVHINSHTHISKSLVIVDAWLNLKIQGFSRRSIEPVLSQPASNSKQQAAAATYLSECRMPGGFAWLRCLLRKDSAPSVFHHYDNERSVRLTWAYDYLLFSRSAARMPMSAQMSALISNLKTNQLCASDFSICRLPKQNHSPHSQTAQLGM